MNELFLVNEDGEIVEKFVNDGKGMVTMVNEDQVVINRKSLRNLTDLERVDFSFQKTNYLVIREMVKESPKYDLALKLMFFINYRDNVLVYSNGKPIKKKDIGKVFNISKNLVSKKLKPLEDEEIIKLINHQYMGQCYVFNPFITIRGKQVEKYIVDLFRSSKWAQLSYQKNKELVKDEY